jgi:four helix bundle protein
LLNIYPFILETLSVLQPLAIQIAKSDPDLARQLRRASSSVALNVAEGSYSRGKNRSCLYHNALGSARESLACLEVAHAMGYIRDPPKTGPSAATKRRTVSST